MKAIICRVFRHRWRTSMERTSVVTGAGVRQEGCTRCRAYRTVRIPAWSETP